MIAARPAILDRYMIAEFLGPLGFGLFSYTLIFAATNILAISRLVSEEHAPLGPAIAYFFWQLPQIVVQIVPVAMLLGTLLSLGRLSGDSEFIALKAGGIGLVRAVAPLLALGIAISLATLAIQELLLPIANDHAVTLRESTIKKVGAFGGGQHTVISRLPGGGEQLTYFGEYAKATQELLYVTIVTYGPDNHLRGLLTSDRGRYESPTWTFDNATTYQFAPDGSLELTHQFPFLSVDVGQKPSQIAERAADNNREAMSRAELKTILDSKQLSPEETRAYQMTYAEKLATPFAAFVFTLFAIPFGLRPTRGGGTGLGFGLSIAIAFVYFVCASVFSAIFTSLPGGLFVSYIGAWAANVIFIAIGVVLLRRAART